MTWENGRELASIRNSSNALIASYEYDASGLRISKNTTSGGTVYYVYDENSNLIFEKHSDYTLAFYYDGNGTRTHFTKKSSTGYETYYYRYNLQGDIIALLNDNGTVVAEYNYTPYGEHIGTVSEIGAINPFRYRGYYFDSETGYYYLQSRYYNPFTCRFINADAPEFLGATSKFLSYNLFAYCENNPVNNVDHAGNVVTPANVVGAAIGAVIGAVGGAVLGNWLANKLNLKGWKRTLFIAGVAALVGAAAGAIGYFIGPYVAKLAKSLGTSVKNLASKLKSAMPKGKSSVPKIKTTPMCFVAGTLVYTDSGHVPIEDIEKGDYVYAKDPETGEKGLKKVVQTFENEVAKIVYVKINNEEIITTPGHPFYIVNKGWIGAEKLKHGDRALLYNGQTAVVQNIKIVNLTVPVKVYNFEVEDFHTYFVGKNTVLVHNKGCGIDKIADKYIKKLGLDAHAIKYEYLGKKAKISLYDLAVNKKTGVIYIINKAGEIVAETIYKLK